MERDIEKIIRLKVMEAEGQAVSWKKDATWTRLEQGLSKKKRKHIWYLAAASVAGMVVLIAYQHYSHLNDRLHNRLTLLESDYHNRLAEVSRIQTVPGAAGETCHQDDANRIRKNNTQSISSTTRISDEQKVEAPQDSGESQQIANTIVAMMTIDSTMQGPFNAPDVIQPIVGVVETLEEPVWDHRKNKLKLIRPSELVYTKDESRNNILARIK